ncbi:GNVR domain-containing protein [Janthinobacterium sp. JC611]|uniref:GNVR domain-containing protein n=1 Tax=Janthinobacterium sp. JC611 TaxID=2816201 RepID=UPI001BFE531D|nr:GNVR domain-containing protein [Janthinobacterium sp. JC611]
MSESVKPAAQDVLVSRSNEIRMVDILIAMARQKTLLISMPIIGGAIALAITLMLKPVFTSSAVLLPPQQQSSGMSAVLGQLGGLGGMAGGLGSLKNPGDLYIGMLQSRTVADILIDRFKLKERYGTSTMARTRKTLEDSTKIGAAKSGLITIDVEDHDAQVAADLANAYVKELTLMTETMAVSEASRRRVFFARQLESAKDKLSDAEVNLKKVQEATGMIELAGQVKGLIANTAQLQGTIAAKEVQLSSMRSFATANNPELIRVQDEIRGLNDQLFKLNKGQLSKNGDIAIPTGKIPEVSIEYIRSLRDVKYYETIFELLAKQFEMAKIDEAKDANLIQVLDKALPAEKKSRPKSQLIVLGGILGGALLGVILALFRDFLHRSKLQNPDEQRWQELRAALRSR